MAQASASVNIPASPDEVWQLVGGFNSLPDWHPYIPKSELSEGGRVRRLSNPNGETITERLEKFDETERSYSYSFLDTPFPVTDYLATLQVQDADGGKNARVIWSGRFTPKGVSEQEASSIFLGIYEDGLKALAANFASRKQ